MFGLPKESKVLHIYVYLDRTIEINAIAVGTDAPEGYRNISNCLSIGTDVEVTSAGLEERARQLGFWNGDGPLHFADTFGAAGCPRYQVPWHFFVIDFSCGSRPSLIEPMVECRDHWDRR